MIDQILILVITVLLISLSLFFADKLIGDKPDSLGGGYFVKAVITSIVIIVLIIGTSAVVGVLASILPPLGQIAPILAFVMGAYAVKYFLLKQSSFEKSVWVALITWVIIYIIDYVSALLGGPDLVQFI
ncbi:MAG: hypothetical protein ACXAE3_06045 [Candidatus Kariarchaeaceae archaeon]|jgi:hypothetical protein